jgi:hypothetical protein
MDGIPAARLQSSMPAQARAVPRTSGDAAVAIATIGDPAVPDNAAVLLLLKECADAPFAEQVLAQLAADEEPVRKRLHDLKNQVVTRLASSLDQPRHALVIAKLLRELVKLSATISHRQQETLVALVAVRTQRRMLAAYNGGSNGV